jgi:hypothetical protein
MRVEPDDALLVADEAVRVRSIAIRRVDFEGLHFASLGVDAADRHGLVLRHRCEPEIAVEIGRRIVRQRAAARGRSHRPVAAVDRRNARRKLDVRIERHVVFLIDHACCFTGRARPGRDLEAALVRSAGAGEIAGKLLLMEINDLVGRRIRPAIEAVDVDHLHRLDHRVPAALVEAVLQRVARRVAARAIVAEDALHALVIVGFLRQAREDEVTRHLSHLGLEIGHRLEHEVLALLGGEIDVVLGGLEAQRLRPDLVFAGLERWEIVGAGLVGEDRRGDGAALGLG